jgi:signal transduction histidine kinase/AmiR/NasT family two-component response regulator
VNDEHLAYLSNENHQLNEQIKQFVKIEQRLYRVQNARDQELRRIHALSYFVLEAFSLCDPDAVMTRAGALLHECFSLDLIAMIGWDSQRKVRVSIGINRPFHPMELRPLELDHLMELKSLILAEDALMSPSLGAVFAQLRNTLGNGCYVAIPAGAAPIVLLAMSRQRKLPLHRDDHLSEVHRSFLELIGTSVGRAIERAALTSDLQARSETLVEINARLSESLKRQNLTQAQLIESSKLEAIGRLAGGIAHDFNNLLTVIINHSSLAAGAMAAGTIENEDLQHVLAAARSAARITSQLLTFGRKQLQTSQVLDLGDVVGQVGSILRSLLGCRTSLTVEVESSCPVFADRSQLDQIIMNLVINARDAMPDGGTVLVRVRLATQADVATLIPALDPSAMVALEVIDTGLGMDEETRQRIFEPFFTTKKSGHGLGLAVVYGVVAQSGGHIRIESSRGHGTRCCVLLPRCDQLASVPPPQAVAQRASLARVLVVEDNEAIRRVVVRILKRAGYQVVDAGDGLEALDRIAAAENPFDLVLTDVNMPRMSGFELADQLVKLLPTAQVMFMTGYSDDLADLPQRARQWPCVVKPFTPTQLLAEIERQVTGAKVAARVSSAVQFLTDTD